MSELRWTILGLGALFIAALVLWEYFVKRRLGGRSDEQRGYADTPADAHRSAPNPRHAEQPKAADPTRLARPEAPNDEFRVIDYDDATAANTVAANTNAADTGVARTDEPRGMRVETMHPGAEAVGKAEQWIAAAGMRQLSAEDLVLDWPADADRHIVALRLQARGTEKLSGRGLRQALLGEGFVFGKMDLFHLPLADGRVILSAASLTKPGGFTLASMDAQVFLGLNLFAVLPGPLAPTEALERMMICGRLLAQRLRADLLDSQGQPLTEARLAELRRGLGAAAAAAAAAPVASTASPLASTPPPLTGSV